MRPLPLPELVGWILPHWRPYRARLLWVVALTFVNAGVVVVYPVFLKRIVDGIEASAGVSFLIRNALWLLVFGAVHALVYYNLMVTRMRINLGLDYGVRMRAFEHLLRMGPGFFTRFRTGDLVTRLTDDVTEKLAWYLCSGILRTLEAVTVIAFGLVMMARMNAELTLWAAGPLPILVGIFVVIAHRLHERYEAVQAAISRINDVLESAFSGIRVIKGFATEPMQTALVEGAVDDQRRAEVRAVRYQTVIDSLYGHIWQLAIVAVLLAGGGMVIAGELTLGELVAFDAYVLLLVWPMFDLGQFLVRGRISAVSIGRISELEDVRPEVEETGFQPLRPRHPLGPAVGNEVEPGPDGMPVPIEFRGVGFRYGEGLPPALDGVSFRAEPGALTALVGEVGTGKSTAIKLAARLMDPETGSVLAAGRPLPDWDADRLRRFLGYVSQEAVLFSTTVRENIRFGRSWITEEDVSMAVRVAGLEPDVDAWSEGMETVVGTQGIRLSGGQKQRVALARALAGRPSVLLLDDCTSALDAATEDTVWEGLFRELPHCTTLLVTHRPATLERADRILVLAGGRPEALGTFDELNVESPLFHELYIRWRLRDRVGE